MCRIRGVPLSVRKDYGVLGSSRAAADALRMESQADACSLYTKLTKSSHYCQCVEKYWETRDASDVAAPLYRKHKRLVEQVGTKTEMSKSQAVLMDTNEVYLDHHRTTRDTHADDIRGAIVDKLKVLAALVAVKTDEEAWISRVPPRLLQGRQKSFRRLHFG